MNCVPREPTENVTRDNDNDNGNCLVYRTHNSLFLPLYANFPLWKIGRCAKKKKHDLFLVKLCCGNIVILDAK